MGRETFMTSAYDTRLKTRNTKELWEATEKLVGDA